MFKSVVLVLRRNVFGGKVRKLHGKPEFTKNTYKVARCPYNHLNEDHLKFFENLLGNSRLVIDEGDLDRYNVDWLQQLRGNSKLVLKPKTTNEVVEILSFCNEQNLAVCPIGGNTGLVGSVPIFDEIIVSMELMNKVIELDKNAGILTCEAGCVLENLNNYLTPYNLIVPLDLGSRGSCQIGGNVATNAGGLRMLRYGNLHANVLGLEIVKADGKIIDCLSALRKDNTGYHIKNIFIGSEGTLGLITKVAIQCSTKFPSVGLAFLGLDSFERVLETFNEAKTNLGEIISAAEVIDVDTMKLCTKMLKLKSPIGEYPYYLLVETMGSNETHDTEKLNQFLQRCLDRELILNGTVTHEQTKYQALWSIRERLAEASKKYGYSYVYDFTLPLNNFYKIVEIMKKRMGNRSKLVSGFGHLGDGNIHLQIIEDQYSTETQQIIEPYIYEKVTELKGSISAEHGIGFLKANNLISVKDPMAMQMMKNLKYLLDPKKILNPYKVIL